MKPPPRLAGPVLAAAGVLAAALARSPVRMAPARSGPGLSPPHADRIEHLWAGVQNEIDAALSVPPEILARIAVGSASEGFDTLAAWSAAHPVAGRPAALSLFSREGRPLAWWGDVRSLEPREFGFAAERIVPGVAQDRLVAERSLGEGLLDSIRLELPFSASGRLIEPFTSALGLAADRLSASVDDGGPVRIVSSSGAPIARLALQPLPDDPGRSTFAGAACLLGLLALVLSFLLPGVAPGWLLLTIVCARLAAPAAAFSPLLGDEWTRALLFARPAPFGILDSPFDLFLTGAAALLCTDCLARLFFLFLGKDEGTPAARARRLACFLTGLALLAPTLALISSIPASSRLNPLRFQLLSPEGPRACLQAGSILLAASALVLIFAGARRGGRSAGGTPRARLGIVAASAIFAGLALAWGASASAIALVEGDLAPDMRRAGEAQERLLRETLEAGAARSDWALDEAGPSIAFRTWQRSPLAASGLRSAVVFFDETGRRVSEFSAGLPLGIDPGTDEGAPLEIRPVTFTLLTLRLPLLQGEAPLRNGDRAAGRVVVFISRETDNIPAFTRNDPLPAGLSSSGADPVYDEYLGGEPVIVLFSPSGDVISSTAERPPALEPQLQETIAASGHVWEQVEMAGRNHRLYFFPAGGGTTAAIGFVAPGPAWWLSAWTRLAVLALAVFLLASAAIALVRAPRVAAGRATAGVFEQVRRSFARRLLVVLLLASILPLAAMSIALTSLVKQRSAAEVESRGVAALESGRRLLSDFIEATGAPAAGGRGFPDPRLSLPHDAGTPPIGNNALFWLSRVVGQDLSVFVEGRLVATSRPDLYSAGVLSPALDPIAARDVLYGRAPYLIRDGEGTSAGSVFIYARIDLPGWSEPGVLALPLTRARRTLRQDAESVGEGLIAMTVLLAGLIAGASYFASRRISGPIGDITRSAARVAEGDYEVRIPRGGSDETGRMTEAFNVMARALSGQREDLRRRGDYIEKILLNATTGVISTDPTGIIRTMNPAARLLLELPEACEGRELSTLLEGQPRLTPLSRHLSDGQVVEAEIDLQAGGSTRRLRVVRLPLAEREGDPPGQLILLEDLTEVARSNRLAAWADMARRIAHEIKNPLTPIQLSAEHLIALHRSADPGFDSVLESCLKTILDQVRALREISGEFSDYARLPDLRPVPTDLARLVREVAGAYRAAPPPGVTVTQRIEPVPERPMDARVFRRALVNLIENAIQAASPGRDNEVTVTLRNESEATILEIRDTGEGMDAAELARAFEPYFSTRTAGTGLGLPIARRAVEEHGGTLTAASQPGSGTSMTIRLPA